MHISSPEGQPWGPTRSWPGANTATVLGSVLVVISAGNDADGHGAHRPMLRAAATFSPKRRRRNSLESGFMRKTRRPPGGKHTVGSFIHHLARDQYRVFDIPNPSHRAEPEARPIHKDGVHLDFAGRIRMGTRPRVKGRIVLERYHGQLRRVQCGTAFS